MHKLPLMKFQVTLNSVIYETKRFSDFQRQSISGTSFSPLIEVTDWKVFVFQCPRTGNWFFFSRGHIVPRANTLACPLDNLASQGTKWTITPVTMKSKNSCIISECLSYRRKGITHCVSASFGPSRCPVRYRYKSCCWIYHTVYLTGSEIGCTIWESGLKKGTNAYTHTHGGGCVRAYVCVHVRSMYWKYVYTHCTFLFMYGLRPGTSMRVAYLL